MRDFKSTAYFILSIFILADPIENRLKKNGYLKQLKILILKRFKKTAGLEGGNILLKPRSF